MKKGRSIFLNKVKKIRMILMDIDGVLTNGQITILNSGEEVKSWNVKDRFGFMLVQGSHDIHVGWISGRRSAEVKKRAKEFNIDILFLEEKDKFRALQLVLKKFPFKRENVAYIGDDLLDLPVLRVVGFSVCPRNAAVDVKREVDFITKSRGGEGVFREVLEIILRAKGKWKKIISKYR